MSYFRPKKQVATPTTGQTVTIANSNVDTRLVLNPAGLISALTIVMPTTPFDGQLIHICSSQIITVITMTSGVTIFSALSTFGSANSFAGWVYDSANTSWFRIT